ncbi:TIM barrel protein [Coraliomargarita algicola]|uniref:TIM barrel protein n=1 Tax=Coraliomargarita algicola TaxID=3092156 RepID=A0ABZ0RSF8_9BACT|nr:TIM barrel protein [Coraliomargarita sp. J2-16]WPJ97837.1 TIM barrel protein [Coraliomargarita sp. J2-16]
MDLTQVLRQHFGTTQQAQIEIKKLPVKINSLNSSCRMLGQSPKDWQDLLELAPWADALEVPLLRVFDGKPSQASAANSHLVEANIFFDWWNAQKAKNNWRVDIMIETHSILTTSKTIQKLQRVLKKPARILWDSHHTWFKGREEPDYTWRAIRPWVSHIHFKDSPQPQSLNDKPSYCIPGCGEFPLIPIFRILCDAEFSGPVSLEWEKQWHPELPPLEEALTACQFPGWAV